MNKIGERQEKWLKALESGKYRQCSEFLHNPNNDSYCCLGVAEEICGVSKIKIDSIGRKIYSGSSQDISHVTGSYLNMTFDSSIYCINMNDRKNLSFKEIASEIRKNPEFFFSSPI